MLNVLVIWQDTEPDQMKGAQHPPSEIQKGEQNLNPIASKPGGKNGKQGSQFSDPTKEEYIHVRARRGQATNSHSLAERVRLLLEASKLLNLIFDLFWY